MSLPTDYTPTEWEDYPSTATIVNATRLKKLEYGLRDAFLGLKNKISAEDANATYAQISARPKGGRFAILGDSIAAGIGYFASGGQVDMSIGEFSAGSWFQQFCLASGGAARQVYNGGIPGNTTTQMLARLSTITALAIDYCFIQGSINDISQGIAQATTLANIDTIAKALRAKGIEPILTTVQPNNTGPGTHFAATTKLNAAIVSYAAVNGIACIDFYGLLVDPTTQGSYVAGMGESASPSVHPSAAGHTAMAQAAWAALAPRLTGVAAPYLAKAAQDPVNMLPNGTFATDTSGVPTGWAAAGSSPTATLSLATDSAVLGRALTVAVSANDGSKAIGVDLTSGFSVGETLAFSGRFKTSVAAQQRGINIYCQFIGSSPTGYLYPIHGMRHDVGWTQWYAEGVVPAGTTKLSIYLTLGSGGTNTNAISVSFAQPTLINRTRLGLAA